MTFEEWWKDKNNNLEMFIRGIFPNKYMDNARLVAKRFSEMAWQAAQPKWTYCKDEMPKNGEKVIALNFIKEMYICNYYSLPKKCNWTCMGVDIENVIAWMPLPEATGNIDK